MKKRDWKRTAWEYILITASTLCMAIGIYYFKFPNNFTFGGVSGLSVVLSPFLPISPSSVNFIINALLLVLGFLFLGRGFGVRTVYSSTLLSVALSVLDQAAPLAAPLTDEPLLELVFAVLLPGFGSAVLFNIGASSGGTDVVAMILRKYTSVDIGRALLLSDLLITLSAFFVFDMKTALFSLLGLVSKSLVVDNVIESINLCKACQVVCRDPQTICVYITEKLHRSATVFEAQGAFSGTHTHVVLTALKPYQAVALRRFIHEHAPESFILITNTSEIIGNGSSNNDTLRKETYLERDTDFDPAILFLTGGGKPAARCAPRLFRALLRSGRLGGCAAGGFVRHREPAGSPASLRQKASPAAAYQLRGQSIRRAGRAA